jgi:hypothetical protein
VIGSWGRLGFVNQHKIYANVQDPRAAVNEANMLLDGKLMKGYKASGSSEVFTCREFLAPLKPLPIRNIDPVPALSIGDALFG